MLCNFNFIILFRDCYKTEGAALNAEWLSVSGRQSAFAGVMALGFGLLCLLSG
jgi:hypothetical protein